MSKPETIRPCPTCGAWPATIYPPKVYHYNGKDHLVRQSYCSTCRKVYTQQSRRVKGPTQPMLPGVRQPMTARRKLTSYTLSEILDDPEPWAHCGRGRRWMHLRGLILDRDNHRCQMRRPGCTDVATQVDHIVPVVDGGDSHPDNLRAACAPCNTSAGSQLRHRPKVCAHCGSLNVIPLESPVFPADGRSSKAPAGSDLARGFADEFGIGWGSVVLDQAEAGPDADGARGVVGGRGDVRGTGSGCGVGAVCCGSGGLGADGAGSAAVADGVDEALGVAREVVR